MRVNWLKRCCLMFHFQFVSNDKLLFLKITILSEFNELNTQQIKHFKVLYLAKRS